MVDITSLLKHIGVGAGTGATVGLLGGPFDEVSVPVGAVIGAGAGAISYLLSGDDVENNYNYNEQYLYSTNEILIGANSDVGSVGLYNNMTQSSTFGETAKKIPIWAYAGAGGLLLYFIYKEVK